jgi:CPA2 family monovalent cation:H+ antiporter-2
VLSRRNVPCFQATLDDIKRHSREKLQVCQNVSVIVSREGAELVVEAGVLSFFAILGVIFMCPLLAHKVKLPVIVIEIIVGVILGQSFLRVITPDRWLDFFSFFGLVYLLFLAGLDIELEQYRKELPSILLIASASLIFPFALGFRLGEAVSIDPFYLGVLLSTTSVGVVIPLAREFEGSPRFACVLLGSTMVVDVVSMFLLTFSLERTASTQTIASHWSYLLFILLFLSPFLLRRLGVGKRLELWSGDRVHFQFEVRLSFALIAAFVLLSEFTGVHAILGAFVAGLVVSELTHKGGELEKKLQSFGYGFFIPFFFTIVGATTDVPSLLSNSTSLVFLLSALCLGVSGKVAGGAIGGIVSRLGRKESVAMGFIHSSRLSLILAGATIGRDLAIIDTPIYSSLVLFAISTVILGPTLGMLLLEKKPKMIRYYPEIPDEFWIGSET